MSNAKSASRASSAVRRNFICHCLEGGLYMGGTAFLSPESVMPKMVQSLGGAAWIIAVMPVLLPASFACAGIFVSPVVERLHRFKPWVLTFGFLQRLPYLITGLILLWAKDIEGALLAIVVLTPVVSGLLGGVTVVAWMEMVTRMLPPRVRPAGWSARYILQAGIALLAGTVIHQTLTHMPGRVGYAWLHLMTFTLLFISWLSQLPMKEQPELHPQPAHHGTPYRRYLASLPRLVFSQPYLLKFVLARFTGTGYLMLVSFLTIHALHVTGRPEADEGHFVSWQAIGTVLGSLLAAWLGYRSGGKVLMQASRIICIILSVWVATTGSFPGFLIGYFVLGFGLFLDRVGDLTLAAELCPLERRSTFQAMLSFCNAFAFLSATSFGGLIYAFTGSFHMVAIAAGSFAVLSMIVLHYIPEPRGPQPVDL
ncbi:MAG TPA: MFS transporter [Prosthecobacter sp.]|nr:MFS transporter [Prosthecobacter sp.]